MILDGGFELVSKYKHLPDVKMSSEYKHLEGVKMPVRATNGSAGYDIFNNTPRDIIVSPNFISDPISTYLKCKLPSNYFLALFPRSSHGFKYQVRLANTTGIIDSDYYNNINNEGEIFVKYVNGPKELIIPRGEAMIQGIVLEFNVFSTELSPLASRKGGIGSTN